MTPLNEITPNLFEEILTETFEIVPLFTPATAPIFAPFPKVFAKLSANETFNLRFFTSALSSRIANNPNNEPCSVEATLEEICIVIEYVVTKACSFSMIVVNCPLKLPLNGDNVSPTKPKGLKSVLMIEIFAPNTK